MTDNMSLRGVDEVNDEVISSILWDCDAALAMTYFYEIATVVSFPRNDRKCLYKV